MYSAKERLIINLVVIPLVIIMFMLLNIGGNSNLVNGKYHQYSNTKVNETIETEIIEQTPDSITIKFTNNGTTDWVYSKQYSIEILDDGYWCVVPFSENVSFIEIAYILEPNQSSEHTYPLNHHTLYPGHYRIIIDSSSTEFDIE